MTTRRAALALVPAALFAAKVIPPSKPSHEDLHHDLDPDAVLAELTLGNRRFVKGLPKHPHESHARLTDTAANGQHPHAVVLTCADSRVPPELLFDQGIGDLFDIRVAGNVANEDEIASIEYAIEHLKAPACVVLGHSSCGAVTAVVQGGPLPEHLAHLTAHTKESVAKVQAAQPDLKGAALIAACVQQNVWQTVEDLLSNSQPARELVTAKHLKIVGAVYHLDTGRVEWLGTHPSQAKLLG